MATRRCSTPDRDHSEDTPKAAKYPDYCRTLTFTDNNGVVRELVFPKALDLDRPKRARTTFSRDQLERLEAEFTANQYLVGRERTQLATTLGLSETQVKVWFQNRRTKHKREKEKQEENQDAKSESLAVRNLLTSLPPSHVTFPAGSAAREPSSLTPFTSSSSSSLHNLPAPCLPRPGAGERDGLPAACSSSPAPCPEDTAALLTTTSRLHHPALPRVSTTVTPTPLYAKDQTALGGGGGGGGTLVHPLSRLGAPPDLRHGGCVPVCSLSSLPGADSPILAAAVRAGTCAPFSGRAIGSGDCALGYGSLRSGAGVPETWGWYPGDVTACQRPVGPVMARAGPIPAAWPLYCHSLTP